jgi:hypothetical protein
MSSTLASYGSSGFVVDSGGDGSVLPLTTRTASTARHRSSRKRVMDDLDRKMLEVDGLPQDHPSASMGPFWFEAPRTAIIHCHAVHKGITRKELLQLEALLKRGSITDVFLRDILIPLNNESSEVPRLRAYNWAVTNYAKGHPLTIVRTNADGSQTFVDPSLSYNQHLKRLHRPLFDPYRRGTLLFFEMETSATPATSALHYTTVGQLSFVCWCIETGVDKYVAEHEDEIRAHMNAALKGRRRSPSTTQSLGESAEAPKKRRIRELTSAPSKYMRTSVAGDMAVGRHGAAE